MSITKTELLKLQNGSDVRGIACEGIAEEHITLTPEAAYLIGQAFAIWLLKKKIFCRSNVLSALVPIPASPDRNSRNR